MTRFVAFLAAAFMAASSSAAGQTIALPEQPLLGSTLTADILQDLPTSNSPFAVLENIQSETIGDRFSAGGLNAATAPRFGSFLNSWTQTQFRIGDVTITDPRAGGTPLLLPTLSWWERVTAVIGAGGVDDNAAALSMTLEPKRPTAKWFRAIEGSLSAPPFVAQATGPVPVVDRVHDWQDGNALIKRSGNRSAGLVAAGSWRRLSHVEAPNTSDTSDRVASGFAHLIFAATAQDEIRVLGWVQQSTTAAATDNGAHVQATWERRDGRGRRGECSEATPSGAAARR